MFLFMSKIKALVLTDDLRIQEIISDVGSKYDFEIIAQKTVGGAMELIGDGARPDVWFIDQQLSDGNGDTLFDWAHKITPAPVTILCTAFPDLSQAVRMTQKGLFHYMKKPFSISELKEIFQRVKQQVLLSSGAPGFEGLVARSPAMSKVIHALKMASIYPSSVVLLTGETGTGKDACARLLHDLTYAKEMAAPFVAFNCAAIPNELVESEMFGSEKGAYTGSIRERRGLVDAAQRGTLFLDEVGELSLEIQAKFLRFLETREYRPIGSSMQLHFNGRLIVATHRDLKKEVKAGRFREDLLYRLDVLNVHLPPLRERPEDIIPLAKLFLKSISEKMSRSQPLISDLDYATLAREPLPGNAREIRNLIERALLSVPPDIMHLNLKFLNAPCPVEGYLEETTSTSGWINFFPQDMEGLGRMEYVEKQMVIYAMDLFHGNISKVSKWLGMSRQQVYRKINKISKQPKKIW